MQICWDMIIREGNSEKTVWIKSKETIRRIGGKTKKSSVAGAEESRGFWGRIWDPPVEQNKSAQWLGKLETDLNGLKQQEY